MTNQDPAVWGVLAVIAPGALVAVVALVRGYTITLKRKGNDDDDVR